jgi:hypothetical protein
VEKEHSTGRPRRSSENMDHVRHSFIRTYKRSSSRGSAGLQIPNCTQKSSEEPTSETVHGTGSPARDKLLRSQFAACTGPQIFVHSRSYCPHRLGKSYISGHVSRLKCVILSGEPLRERLEHQRGSHKMNMRWALTYGGVIDPFFF